MLISAKSSMPLKSLKQAIYPACGIAVFLVLWNLLSLRPDTSLPSPVEVVNDTWDLIRDPFFYKGGNNKGFFWLLLASLKRVVVGFALAAILGVLIGFLVNLSDGVKQSIDPIIQLLRPIAPLAWLPLAQAIFLKPDPSAIFVIFITAIWPIILNTALGLQLVPKDYINVSKVLEFNVAENFFKIMLPAALPNIFTGLRIAIGLSWLAVVAAEMLLSDDGLGFFIVNAYNNSDISDIILALVYLGATGLIIDKIMAYISFKITPQQ